MYTPRHGSPPERLIRHLRDTGAAHITREDAIAQFGFFPDTIMATLGAALKGEVLLRHYDGGKLVGFKLGTAEPALPPPEPSLEPVPFEAAVYMDGSVMIQGLELKDGAILLTPDQASRLRVHLAHFPACGEAS